MLSCSISQKFSENPNFFGTDIKKFRSENCENYGLLKFSSPFDEPSPLWPVLDLFAVWELYKASYVARVLHHRHRLYGKIVNADSRWNEPLTEKENTKIRFTVFEKSKL